MKIGEPAHAARGSTWGAPSHANPFFLRSCASCGQLRCRRRWSTASEVAAAGRCGGGPSVTRCSGRYARRLLGALPLLAARLRAELKAAAARRDGREAPGVHSLRPGVQIGSLSPFSSIEDATLRFTN